MRSIIAEPAAAPGTGSAGAVIHVPAAPGTDDGDAGRLSQAERAARALAQDRGRREIPIDRAYLEASLDLDRAIRTLVAAFVPRFADWCFVDLVDEAGVPRRVAVAPADVTQAPLAAEMLSVGFGPGWATPSAQTIRDRTPRLYREVTPELMAWATHDERHLAVFRAMGPRSLVAVPLVARDRVVGAVTVFRSTTVPPLDESALRVAEEIAAPAALAIDNARAFEAERKARLAAEARGAEREAGEMPRRPAPRKVAKKAKGAGKRGRKKGRSRSR